MIVCLCHGVSEREIKAWSELGGERFEDLQGDLGVATNCGDCRTCALSVLEDCRRQQSETQPIKIV